MRRKNHSITQWWVQHRPVHTPSQSQNHTATFPDPTQLRMVRNNTLHCYLWRPVRRRLHLHLEVQSWAQGHRAATLKIKIQVAWVCPGREQDGACRPEECLQALDLSAETGGGKPDQAHGSLPEPCWGCCPREFLSRVT